MPNGVLVTNFDYRKIFIWGNLFKTATYTNSTGSTVTLSTGLVMGRVNSTGKVLPMVSTATNGSQVPMGVLKGDYTVANGATVTVTICFVGQIAQEKLIFSNGTDVLTTQITVNDSAGTPNTVPQGIVEDILCRAGLSLISGTDHTSQDNQ
jgi:hypothetical protein